MRLFCRKDHWVLVLTTFCLVLFAFAGCAVGPASVKMGRAAYNEAINSTENEQMLLSIVKGRYGETFSLLAVNAVAANVRFGVEAGTHVGIGPSENYATNLVPFSAGLAYEENPTITYTPVIGDKYLRQLMSPISLDILVLFNRSGTHTAMYLTMLANRINDMQNPNFFDVGSAGPDPRFQRFVELNRELGQAGVIQWLADPKKEAAFEILITGYAPTYSERVREYLNLLGLPMPTDESEGVVIPVYFAVKGKRSDGIAMSTRSTYDLIQILRAAIEVPPEHAAAGLAINYPSPAPAGKDIHIYTSEGKPERAVVAVKYRGFWFYIDETDMQTKLFYTAVRMLWSVSIAAVTDQTAAPVLTLPVSR